MSQNNLQQFKGMYLTSVAVLMAFEIQKLENELGGLFYDSEYHFQYLLRYCTIKASPGLSGPAIDYCFSSIVGFCLFKQSVSYENQSFLCLYLSILDQTAAASKTRHIQTEITILTFCLFFPNVLYIFRSNAYIITLYF